MFSLGLAGAHGFALRHRWEYSPDAIKEHKAWVLAAGICMIILVLVVEVMIVPVLHRHYTLRHWLHFACWIVCLPSYVAAIIVNPVRYEKKYYPGHVRWHHILGRTAVASGILGAFLGLFILFRP